MTVITRRPPKHKYYNNKLYFRKYIGLVRPSDVKNAVDVLRRSDFNARSMKYKDKAGRVRYAVYARGNKKRLKQERIARAKAAAKNRRR